MTKKPVWVRKNEDDRATGRDTPLPTQLVSNEEFSPIPQTEEQLRIEKRIFELADQHSRKLGMSRRAFLRTSGGMATAFLALNETFGNIFTVSTAEAMEVDAYRERWPKNEFIFDAQTHHVKDSITGPLAFRRITARLGFNDALIGVAPRDDDLHRGNYMKEIFFDSDTLMAIMSGAAIGPVEQHTLTIEDMIATRNSINEAAGSQRMLSHGIVDPRQPNALDELERQVAELKIDGWKLYTGNVTNPFMLDDENIAYPFIERSLKLGITTISVHKGLSLGPKSDKYFMPTDIPKVARDFPEMNFIIYHSGMQKMLASAPPGTKGAGDDGYIAWTTDLVNARLRDPSMTNVYMELGGVFGFSAITHPTTCGHLLGQIIKAFGADHVIWGTDCIWWGSPQWLIEAFRRFQIPQELQDKFGYAPITTEDKAMIFGPNLARIYNVDIDAARTAFPDDAFSNLKVAYEGAGAEPSNTSYGWIAV